MKCLVFGVKDAVGLSTVRSLQEAGHSVVCADTHSIAQGLYYENVQPYLLEKCFNFDRVLDIIEAEEVDVVFVSEREQMADFANQSREISRKGAFLPLPDEDVLDDLLDKRELCKKFNHITPRVFSEKEGVQFPVTVRGRYTRREGGVPVVDSRRDLEFELKKAKKQDIRPIIQEHIPEADRNEYIVSAICDREGNKTLTVFNILSKSWDFRGNIQMMETSTNENVLSEARSIINELELKGTHIKLLFRMNEEGIPKLLNASPILCELQKLGYQVGRHTASILCDIATGENISMSSEYQNGVKSVRNTVYMSVGKNRIMGGQQ